MAKRSPGKKNTLQNVTASMVTIGDLKDYPDIKIPKRVKKYILIWCSKGEITMMVDHKELLIKKNEVLTITSGQIHYLKQATYANGLILDFSLDYFCKSDHDIELIFHNGLFCHFDLNEVIPLKDGSFIESQLKEIARELETMPYQYLISVHSRIELVLIAINRAKVERGDEIWKPDAMFLKFLEMIRSNFERNYTLGQAASALGTTTAKLNELSRLHTDKTAQQVMYGLIVSEAKRLLMYEDLSIKEVAFKLGFKDPFYFSNFFKKHARLSPKTYQDKYAI